MQGRENVKKAKRSRIRCKKERAQPIIQQMADLHESRLVSSGVSSATFHEQMDWSELSASNCRTVCFDVESNTCVYFNRAHPIPKNLLNRIRGSMVRWAMCNIEMWNVISSQQRPNVTCTRSFASCVIHVPFPILKLRDILWWSTAFARYWYQ